MTWLPSIVPDRIVATRSAAFRVDGVEVAERRTDDDRLFSAPSLVVWDALRIQSAWVAVFVEGPCNTGGGVRFLADDKSLYHFHLDGFSSKTRAISLAFKPVGGRFCTCSSTSATLGL